MLLVWSDSCHIMVLACITVQEAGIKGPDLAACQDKAAGL